MRILRKSFCISVAKKHKTPIALQKNDKSVYNKIWSNWLNEFYSKGYLSKTYKPNGYWTKTKCKNEAKKYKTKSDFKSKRGGAWQASRINKWINEFFGERK